ncbi:GerA spore germination protein [Paenibacillus curdlanolyticus YK9]|uniref:GerA spore germination protein n=1 Tax=Paenibacillus curdlanolyticus YK9 TaxID=717606 RepID=E0I4L9_9BACL|nr:spore germination protein [Paenibacillus curdlanolyticus]EFM12550.1 GerA spore germination protein [Paenibacillus curdlanolyticus YK9]
MRKVRRLLFSNGGASSGGATSHSSNSNKSNTSGHLGAAGRPVASGQLETDLDANINRIRSDLATSPDLIVRKLTLRVGQQLQVAAIYMDTLTNKESVNEFVMKSLMSPFLPEVPEGAQSPEDAFQYICSNALAVGQIEVIDNWTNMLLELLTGKTILLVNGWSECICGNTIGGETRAVSEASTQVVIRGPKDSFSEAIATNISLVRRRIRSPHFGFEVLKIGAVTQTSIAMLYIEGIAKPEIVQEVRTRLGKINTDAILESGYIEEFIEDNWNSPFPTVFNTERPDVIAANLLEGRVAILVDGTPFALVVPTVFAQFFASAEDYYQRYDIGTFIRLLRYMAFVISLFGPAFYIALTTFHQEMLPTSLLINLSGSREGVPFPAIIEAFSMEISFEILREAGVRMPRAVGQTVSIVGALVLGEAAVQAGIVSPIMVIVVAITAIANFSIPAYNMAITARLLRFLFMLAAGFLGFYGIVLGMIMMIGHMNALRSIGVSFLSPLVPLKYKQMKDIFLRLPHWSIRERPDDTAEDTVRMPPGQQPG